MLGGEDEDAMVGGRLIFDVKLMELFHDEVRGVEGNSLVMHALDLRTDTIQGNTYINNQVSVQGRLFCGVVNLIQQ